MESDKVSAKVKDLDMNEDLTHSQMQRGNPKKKKKEKLKPGRVESSSLTKKSPFIENIDSTFAISKQNSEEERSAGKPVTFEKSEIAKQIEDVSATSPRKKKTRR